MKSLRDLFWILPTSLLLGLGLSLFGPGVWWIGWLAYFIILALGLLALAALWRTACASTAGTGAGAGRGLAWMLGLSLVLRLGVGIFFSSVLPVYGDDNEANRGGYIYRDAYTYDTQAWELASSGDPLWKAFDRSSGIEEQYGGLTITLSLAYRLLSPDAHRPWLTILLSALMGALGVALAWKGARQAWGVGVALVLGWSMALYPESLFSGASQIREPYLLLFIGMLLWAASTLQAGRQRTACLPAQVPQVLVRQYRRYWWIWLAGGVAGLFLFSPGVAVAALLVLGVWFWLARRLVHIRWWWVAGAAAVILLAGLLFSQIVAGTLRVQGGPLANLVSWLKIATNTGAYNTTLNSGWLQTIFQALPEPLHLPFIVAYGVAQPVLPAAIADPGVWPVRLIGILRGLGWYVLLPFLLYCLLPIWKTTDKRARLAWAWLWLAVWAWIILASARAGGDQWDNPRYRVIMLMFQAALAAYALLWARQNHDRWLGRALAVEGEFLLFFGYWYIARYTHWEAGQVHIFVIFALIAVFGALILVGGFFWDRRKKK